MCGTAVAAPLRLKLNILHGGFLCCPHNLVRFTFGERDFKLVENSCFGIQSIMACSGCVVVVTRAV